VTDDKAIQCEIAGVDGLARRGAAAAVAPDAREGIAARRDRRRPGFTIRVSDDRRPAYLRWEPDDWRT
jgi:hypothetical protein